MGTSSWVRTVEEGDFQSEVIDRSHEVPVVVDFWAPWCGPCRALTPVLEGLIQERKGEVILAKVNLDEAPNLADTLGIMSLPTVIAFRGGRAVLDFIGLLSENEIRVFLDRIGPSPADRLAHQACNMEKTDPAAAEKIYRQALDSDPNQGFAILGLARIFLDAAKYAEARDLLENAALEGEQEAEGNRLEGLVWLREQVGKQSEAGARKCLEADPKNPRLMYDLGCVLAAEGRYPEALETLLKAGQRDASLASTKVREAMVKIFQIVGVGSPLADEYRNKLAALLY